MVKHRVSRPWIAIPNSTTAWDRRTYALNLSTGWIQVLYEKWISQTDLQGNSVKAQKVAGSLENPDKYPELTADQVEKLFTEAEASDCSLKHAYGKVVGVNELSKVDLGRLATCPECFATNPVVEVASKVEVSEQVIAKFLAELSPAEAVPQGKLKRPAAAPGI